MTGVTLLGVVIGVTLFGVVIGVVTFGLAIGVGLFEVWDFPTSDIAGEVGLLFIAVATDSVCPKIHYCISESKMWKWI